jgi:fatty acid desaturase
MAKLCARAAVALDARSREEWTVKRTGDRHRLMGAVVLLLAGLACRPVIAIGWSEMAIVLVVAAVLVGPLLFRLYRVLARLQNSEDAQNSQHARAKRERD